MTTTLHEPARETPVVADCDVVVVGGSCTGVFAAVAAARLGKSVCLVEQLNQFGGTATASMVCVWHSLWDTKGELRITSGLTQQVMDRLAKRKVVVEQGRDNPHWQYAFVPAELAIELDALVLEHRIRPFLHARVAAVVRDDRRIQAVIIEDTSGRRAIRARAVIDASGNADVLRRAGIALRTHEALQPPTTAALVSGIKRVQAAQPDFNLGKTLFDPANPKALRNGFVWRAPVPGNPDLQLIFGTRVHGVDTSDADALTRAEMEGRRQVRQVVDLVREACPQENVTLAAIPARIGIRETGHADCLHRLTEQEVLHGRRFDDAIANGSYRVDIHSQGGGGLIFRYYDGREVVVHADQTSTAGRWRPEQAVDPTFAQIPYRSLVPKALDNVLVAGRCLDADPGAFGAVRVMVTCNQMGEAAGTAAALSLEDGRAMAAVETGKLRRVLADQGATVI